MSCGGGAANIDFDKLFAQRFNELDSLISSSPSSPAFGGSSCKPCRLLSAPSAGVDTVAVVQWVIFGALVVGIAMLLMYIFKKMSKGSKKRRYHGDAMMPSVGGQGGTVPTPPRAMTGDAKIPIGSGNVADIQDPAQIVPQSNDRIRFNMFHADWCGHCKALRPDFMQAAAQNPDCDFGLVEASVLQKHPQADGFNIQGFPVVIAYLGSKKLAEMVGNQKLAGLMKLVQEAKQKAGM